MPRIEAESICLLRTSALGDVVNALVLVNGLRRGYPSAHITWITQTVPGELIAGHPAVDRFITYDRRMRRGEWIRFIRKLHRESFDLLIVPQVSMKASLLTWAIRSPVKLGYDIHRARELNWFVTTHRIPPNPMGHVVDQNLEFLAYLGIEPRDPEWKICLTDAELEWRKRWMNKVSRPMAAFVSASSRSEKDWPEENYAVIIDRVDRELGLQPVIIGGPGSNERERANRILKRTAADVIIALEKPIRHTLIQLSASRVVIAPDTGPLHMAVALNIPTVGLYGYSNPNRCGPYRFRELCVDAFNSPGTPPERVSRKTRPGRMATITPDMVFDKIKRALTEPYAPDYPLK
ncbi:glycosyltransferase family 9 protein [bacterium]|nr:glycosyltransferase family 9 protein [candidate division CSSED10-310 bacterium]